MTDSTINGLDCHKKVVLLLRDSVIQNRGNPFKRLSALKQKPSFLRALESIIVLCFGVFGLDLKIESKDSSHLFLLNAKKYLA